MGHLCIVVSEQKYQEEIGHNTWMYTTPACQKAFDPTLGRTAGDVLQKH